RNSLVQSLLTEKVPFTTPVLLCDNLSIVSRSHNSIHIKLGIFFLQKKVLNKSLMVQHIPALDQNADISQNCFLLLDF
ncbi:hypothetical protein CR513_22314, partial [Mucuna pruriens]